MVGLFARKSILKVLSSYYGYVKELLTALVFTL
ncbi:hypothetical protein Niako_6889 [Niastella koreensis GR20-10]|uniref:Uncharacterized protein n=1 Tax=Niastella koreensis (strain DSM 17620 / KACC 11465 / NBRC 106392 / GR20-10) TaxID=700598 RepID=G8TMU0_NIAKG|nr:hypothetical protein Niako_6889 [Niastella koreensis GR20-10]